MIVVGAGVDVDYKLISICHHGCFAKVNKYKLEKKMNLQLKTMVDSMLNLAETLEGVADLGELSVRELLRIDMLKFLLYLSSSDGIIDETEAKFIKDYLNWDMPPALWKKFIVENNVYSTDFESQVPVGLTVFLKADNNVYRKGLEIPDICELYISTFEAIGNMIIRSDGAIDNQEIEDFNIYINMLKDYVRSNALRNGLSGVHSASGITKNLGQTSMSCKIVKGVQDKNAKFLICPNCGKLIPNKGTYCAECFEDFDAMIFNERNYKNPISEVKYYDLSSDDKKEYKKICFITESVGYIFSPYEKEGTYTEDYFSESFKVQGEIIVTDDNSGMGDQYVRSGDYLYDPQTIYNGTIPNKPFFEAYCSFNQYIKPIWFFSNGTVKMYDGSGNDAKVSDEGRYIREGELIRLDLTDKKTGEKRINYRLVVGGKLCRDAYANDNGMTKIKALGTKPMVGGSISSLDTTITQKEFFDNYPCQWCNARRCFGEQSWKYTSFGCISVSGRCRKCNGFFTECEEPENLRKIAYRGSDPNPYYRPTAGATRYLDNPCPYCGSYQVRRARWEDKQLSAAFWGFFSQKLHSNYKCEKCGKMWE